MEGGAPDPKDPPPDPPLGYICDFHIMHAFKYSNCASITVSSISFRNCLKCDQIYENRYHSLSDCFDLIIHNFPSKLGIYLKSGLIVQFAYNSSLMNFQLDIWIMLKVMKSQNWDFGGYMDLHRGGFRGVSEVSGNHSGFSLDDGCAPFRPQCFTRHTQWAE